MFAATATGCTDDPNTNTISGSWRASSDGIYDDGACFDGFFFADTVRVTIRDRAGTILAEESYACADEGFELDVPRSITDLRVELSAGASEGHSGDATLELSVHDDADLGTIKFQP